VAELVVREYAAGDEWAINDAYNAALGLRRPHSEWDWKYSVWPHGRWVMVAVDPQGRVLAHCAALGASLRVGGRVVRGGWVVDRFATPDAAGRVEPEALARTVEQFHGMFGTPDMLAMLLGFLRERDLREGDPRLRYDQMLPQPVAVWGRSAHRHREMFSGHDVRQGLDPRAADDLWFAASTRYAVATVRDAARQVRRFTGRPGVEYGHLSAWRESKVHASAVVRVEPPVTYVADLVWDGDDTGALVALDRAIGTGSLAVGAERIEMWLMGDERATEVLRRLGWQQRGHPERLALVAGSFDPAIDVRALWGRFYVTLADSDLV
jgi:hypothetical protein